MADYLGQIDASSTVYIYFTTHAQTGAAVAPSSGFEAADVRLYKNGSSTERSSNAGWTMTSPFDSVTGLHCLAIDLSDNTDAGFYAAGSKYTAVLVPDETVDGLAVVRVLAYFNIGPVSANVTQFGGTALTAASGIPEVKVASIAANAITATAINADAITAAKIADGAIDAATFASGAINAAAIAADAITDAKVASDVTIASVTGAVGSVTGAVGSVTGAVGSVTGDVGGNVTGSVGSVATGGITAASIAADAIGASELAADAATEIATAVWAAATRTLSALGFTLGASDLAADTITAAKIADGAIDAATFATGAITADAIAADAIGASELAADAVTEIQSGLATAAALSTVAGYVDTEVAAILAAVDTEVAAIKAKTDNLPAAPAAVGDIPTATQNADALLKRDMSAVTGEADRSPLNALRAIRNKTAIAAGTLTVYEEDDTTEAWTATVTTAAGDPLASVDPS